MRIPLYCLGVLLLAAVCCPMTSLAQKTDEGTSKSVTASKTTVYYFHGSRRCKTCMSVESVSRGLVEDKYADNKNIVFRSVNIEEEKNEKLAERFEVAGSALLVSSGKKTEDLTTQAFQYARSKPEKLRSALVAAIDASLK